MSEVRVLRTLTGFKLLRDGRPFFVQGAGGRHHLPELAALGGNAVRTWHAGPELEAFLDRAHQLGLAVAVGIDLVHVRHGGRYDDPSFVEAQAQRAREIVAAHRNHPAVLLWGIGNEMALDGDPAVVYRATNVIARAVREVDPHHPTMAVVAGIGERRIHHYATHCPDVDILGVNAYGALPEVPEALLEQGYDGPYLVTEFGPVGHWETPQTSWGAPIEPDGGAKAQHYAASYDAGVLAHRDRCLGAFAFLWGNKQERTPTWYSMWLESGERTPAVDVMSQRWTGQWPEPRVPHGTVDVEVQGQIVAPSTWSSARIEVDATGPCDIHWVLAAESDATSIGGDPEAEPAQLARFEGPEIQFAAPETPGAYRLFVYVRDQHGGATTANAPFQVGTAGP